MEARFGDADDEAAAAGFGFKSGQIRLRLRSVRAA